MLLKGDEIERGEHFLLSLPFLLKVRLALKYERVLTLVKFKISSIRTYIIIFSVTPRISEAAKNVTDARLVRKSVARFNFNSWTICDAQLAEYQSQ